MKSKPTVFKDGKKVDMSLVSDQWIDGDILRKEMDYIARMSEGLATGTMSDDVEYIDLKNEVVKGMIDKKVESLKKKLSQEAKKKSEIYDHATIIQNRVKQDFQKRVSESAKDHPSNIEISGPYKSDRGYMPISLGGYVSPKWNLMNVDQIKQEIEKRQETLRTIKEKEKEIEDEKVLKEVQDKLKSQKKTKKKETKKKAVKKNVRKNK